MDAPRRASGALGRAVGATPGDANDFADALMAFLAAARRTRGRMQPLFEDITVPQLVLMDAIDETGVAGISAVAELAGLSQPTVTRSVAGLVRQGLAQVVADTTDARRRAVTLTPQGEEFLDTKREVVADHLAGAWGGLSDTERALAAPLLRHLADIVDGLL